mmetsp:Transcript_46888/g.121398  ORF Transcript_46888/g.121398 Transcript_46888/m.121398 type:complete len:478 (+) Transcript_46888:52-1485(+)
MSAQQGDKRKIGGRFGAAVGASTKRKVSSWRDEVEEGEEPAAAAGGAAAAAKAKAKASAPADSDSDEVLDPGTPLPSEDEAENADGAAAEGSTAATVEGGEAAAGDDAAATGAGENGTATGVAASEAGKAADSAAPVSVASSGRPPVVVSLDLAIGNEVLCPLFALLSDGLDQATEKRLTACVPPEGGEIEAILLNTICVFGGHGGVPPEVARAAKLGLKAPPAADGDNAEAKAASGNGAAQDSNGNAKDSGAATRTPHAVAGLLSAPREGPGLVLTLGPCPALDATHVVIGPVLAGRPAFARLRALAPLSGEPKPRVQLALRATPSPEAMEAAGPQGAAVKPEGDGSMAAAVGLGGARRPHPVLLLEEPQEAQGAVPFACDKPEAKEDLDCIALELDGRDLEIQELRALSFSRERQNGVMAVEDSIRAVEAQLGTDPPKVAAEGTEEAAAEAAAGHQRLWLRERCNHLLRVLKKLH